MKKTNLPKSRNYNFF